MSDSPDRKSEGEREGSEIDSYLEELVTEGSFGEEFFELCARISRRHKSKVFGRDLSAQELEEADGDALDFILELSRRGAGVLALRKVKGLKKEFGRFIARTGSPAAKEIWKKVSAALRELARDGKIRRLTGDMSDENGSDTVYSAAPDSEDDRLVSLKELDERSAEIASLTAVRRVGAAGKRVASLGTPTEIRELVLEILNAALAPACLRDIHTVVEGKILAAVEVRVVDPDGKDESLMTVGWTLDSLIGLDSESNLRASKIWQRAKEEAQWVELLCGYLLPKYFSDKKPTLSKFGEPQRIHEEVSGLKAMMAEELPSPDDVEESPFALGGTPSAAKDLQDRQETWMDQRRASVLAFADSVFEQLREKCSEK